MRDRAGKICMLAGAALLIAALSLFTYNRYLEWSAARSVEQLLPRLLESAVLDPADDGDAPDEEQNKERTVELDGYTYMGILSIPSLDLMLPVMADLSYPQLKIAPCRFSGFVDTDDLVIAAHNYERHFGKISSLSEGDTVSFTCLDGRSVSYEVVCIDTLSPDEAEKMTSGEYDLTLFTCTYGGKSRVTVRCMRTTGENPV